MTTPTPDKQESRITFGKLKRAADTMLVVNQTLEVEDEFNGLYKLQGNNVLMQPPFNPVQLIALCNRNNILQQCVHAMEVNIDGTGHTIEAIEEGSKAPNKDSKGKGKEPKEQVEKDDEEKSDPEKRKAEDFFKEPFPGMSMIALRRKLRVDLEQTGYAYLEVIRNLAAEPVALRHLDAKTMRLVQLDDAVEVEKELPRDGKMLKIKMQVRERRFCQKVGQVGIFYKEFGSTRKLNRKTGEWADATPVADQASEIIYIIVDRDSTTPYGAPRWINNLPSVMGSRKAEEFNLDFFDAGGIPPAMVLVEGGSMATGVKDQLTAHLSGSRKSKHRAMVVEIASAGGTLKDAGKVNVTVERFGSQAKQDAMFQQYDEKTEEHVRVAFRLPPLFLGKSADYNFATAMTSYMVAEAQVFAPERLEFDEMINGTIMKALGITKYKFVSKPIMLKNMDVMLKAIELGADAMDGDEKIKVLNAVSGLTMEHSQKKQDQADAAADLASTPPPAPVITAPVTGRAPAGAQKVPTGAASGGAAQPKPGLGAPSAGGRVQKSSDELANLLPRWSEAVGMRPSQLTREEKADIIEEVRGLDGYESEIFNNLLAAQSFVSIDSDPEGLVEIAGAAANAMTYHREEVVRKEEASAQDQLVSLTHALVGSLEKSSQATVNAVSALVAEVRKPLPNQKIDLQLEMKMPDRKPVVREATLPNGQKITLKSIEQK